MLATKVEITCDEMAEALGAIEAVGLASSILTFVDVGYKIVCSAYEIYSSTTGATQENTHILGIVTDLESVTASIHTSYLAVDDAELVKLSKKCQALSQDLLKLLRSVQAKNRSKRQSFKAAISAKWSQKEVSSIEERLGAYRQQIIYHLSTNFLCVAPSHAYWFWHSNRTKQTGATDEESVGRYSARGPRFP